MTLLVLVFLFFTCSNNEKKQNKKDVTIGVQSYSYRTMVDQSPLAILKYIKESGVKHVELMGYQAESFAGAPESPMKDSEALSLLYKRYRKEKLSDEEEAIVAQFTQDLKIYEEELKKWIKNVDYGKFEELKNLYAEAGISIFAFKPSVFSKDNSDDEIRYGMRAAKALGASHVTLEHPGDDSHTFRLAKIAEEEKILIGYHGHEQQTPVFWNTAIAQSHANRMNLDFGHYVAAENENLLGFIKEKHDKIVSMHLKDRQKKAMEEET